MPELPEVETVRRSLEPLIKNRAICQVDLRWPGLLKETRLATLQGLVGSRFLRVRRRGKTLLLDLDRAQTMLFHLKMTGQLFLTSAAEPIDKHDRLILKLDSLLELRFRDSRKFGYLMIFPTAAEAKVNPLSSLGPEPDSVTLEQFISLLSGHKGKIKPLLLRQDIIAGIGNIYADEILYRARINPEKPTSQLNRAEFSRVYESMKEILSRAIRYRGTTVRTYRDGLGEQGDYQRRLQVYGREGKKCPACGQPIERKKVGGRSSFFCPRCQRLKSTSPPSYSR